MKIGNLTLRNFRSHRDTTFEFSRVNIIGGLNGSGKSSVQMALELLLTGRCDITDQAGRGAQALISTGAQELTIEAQLEQPPLTLVPMQYKRSAVTGQLVIGPHAGQSATAWLEANVAPISVLSSVLNAHRFLQMSAKEQKALLAGALAADPVEIDKSIVEIFNELGTGPWTKVQDAAEVDRIYKKAFDARTQVNRDIKAIGSLEAPAEPQEKHSLAEVRQMIADIGKDRDAKVAERSKALADYQAKSERLAAAQAQVKLYEPDLLESDQLEQCRKDAKGAAKVKKLKEELAAREAELVDFRRTLANLRSSTESGNCPTCGQAIPGRDEDETAALNENIEQIEKAITKADEDVTRINSDLRKLPDPTLAQEKIDRHQRAMKPYNSAEIVIREIGELGEKPDVSDIDEEIAALDRRIAAGNQVADEVSKYEGAKQLYERNLARVEKLKSQATALDRLCGYFGDKGPLKAKLVSGKLPAFRNRMNEVLTRFGFECEFELEPFAMNVARFNDEGRMIGRPLSLEQLSESEQYRFSIAFSIALAETTGVNLVVIDRSDMLSAEARQQLAGVLLESSLDQAFVLCTREPEPSPEIEDVRFIHLANDNGSTVFVNFMEEAHANR